MPDTTTRTSIDTVVPYICTYMITDKTQDDTPPPGLVFRDGFLLTSSGSLLIDSDRNNGSFGVANRPRALLIAASAPI